MISMTNRVAAELRNHSAFDASRLQKLEEDRLASVCRD